MEVSKKSAEQIKQFWNENPVGSNFVEYQETRSFYEDYDRFRYRTEAHILEELDKLDLKNKKTLEIGLGQGADSMQLIDRGAVYYGIDLTEESVRRVKERFKLFNKKFEEVNVANAEMIPYPDNFFDIVYTHGVIHHSPSIDKITTEIHRVLKPGGQAVIMLYHKNSFNYHISIRVIRRIGLLLLMAFPFLSGLIAKLTGENKERINRHKALLKKEGLSYLQMKNFLHRSTDGPDNVYSSVWTTRSARRLLSEFASINTYIHFLNERHLLGIQYLLPKSIRHKMAHRFGWHLWIKAAK
ncbi:MAG TPA: class I SAM-dependent methyltransferase [Chitinophagaceae bacterium]|nr:class I SAM-dependent methyltransferase [Chitinophagaceae bacterium]